MSFDTSLVVGFLILTLIVGLGHGQKVKTIKDYALGGRNFSTGALVSTITATWITGSGFFIVLSKTYTDGLYYFFASSCMAIQLFIIAFIFVPRMQEFLGKTSVAEAMGDLYGNRIRIITALTGTLGAIGTVAVQFKAFGTVLSYFSGYSSSIAIVVSGIIVIAYSASGGIRAVTITDVLQFVAFGFAIPFVGMMVWNELFHYDLSILNTLENTKFNYKVVLDTDNTKFWTIIPLALYFIMPGMEPAFCQRIIIGRDIKQVKKAFIISALVLIFIKLAIAWISFLIFTVNPNIEQNNLLGYIIDNYTITGMKGLVIVGIIAMAMSTADSYINSSSVLFANDICSPLKIGIKKELFISRLFAVILGLGAIILALSNKDLLSIILIASSFYMPIITAPLILTILGFRTTEKSVLIGMCAGVITVFFWDSLGVGADSIIISILINALFLLTSHYLLKQKGGWISTSQESTNSIRKSIHKFYYSFINLNIMAFLNKIAPQREINYVSLGIYFLLYTITTIYSTQIELVEDNGYIVLAIYQVMLVTSTIMLMFPIWPQTISDNIKKDIVKVFWFTSIIYMLVLFNTFFVIISGLSKLQFSIFSINLIITALLVGWKLSIIIIPLGFYLSIKFAYLVFDKISIGSEIISPDFILIYAAMLTCTVLIIFLKPKQEEHEATEQRARDSEKEAEYTKRELQNILQGFDFLEKQLKQKEGRLEEKEKYLRDQLKHRNKEIHKLRDIKDEFLRNIEHEFNTPLTGVLSLCEVVYSCYDDLNESMIKSSMKDIVNSGDRLKTYINSIIDVSKLSATKCKLDKKDVNLSKLAKDRPALYKKIFSDETEKQEFIFDVEDNIIVNCDEYYITQAMDNLISNAVSYGRGKPISISLKKTKDNQVRFDITDQGIGIPNTELLSIFTKFKVSSKTWTPAGGRGVGLALCQSAIEAHGGTISVESKEDKGSTFTFLLMLS